MIVLVGLGNPGEKYRNTRHNTGFLFLDYVVSQFEKEGATVSWEMKTRFKAEIAECSYKGQKISFVKPQTYMNESGWSVQQYMHWNKVQPDKLILIHDDLDIPLGKFKYNTEKGPKVHYGILSVEGYLKTKNFTRLRIGVDHRNSQEGFIPGVSYVMGNFTSEEQQLLQDAFAQAYPELLATVRQSKGTKEEKSES